MSLYSNQDQPHSSDDVLKGTGDKLKQGNLPHRKLFAPPAGSAAQTFLSGSSLRFEASPSDVELCRLRERVEYASALALHPRVVELLCVDAYLKSSDPTRAIELPSISGTIIAAYARTDEGKVRTSLKTLMLAELFVKEITDANFETYRLTDRGLEALKICLSASKDFSGRMKTFGKGLVQHQEMPLVLQSQRNFIANSIVTTTKKRAFEAGQLGVFDRKIM